jgi:hypothetical protein
MADAPVRWRGPRNRSPLSSLAAAVRGRYFLAPCLAANPCRASGEPIALMCVGSGSAVVPPMGISKTRQGISPAGPPPRVTNRATIYRRDCCRWVVRSDEGARARKNIGRAGRRRQVAFGIQVTAAAPHGERWPSALSKFGRPPSRLLRDSVLARGMPIQPHSGYVDRLCAQSC